MASNPYAQSDPMGSFVRGFSFARGVRNEDEDRKLRAEDRAEAKIDRAEVRLDRAHTRERRDITEGRLDEAYAREKAIETPVADVIKLRDAKNASDLVLAQDAPAALADVQAERKYKAGERTYKEATRPSVADVQEETKLTLAGKRLENASKSADIGLKNAQAGAAKIKNDLFLAAKETEDQLAAFDKDQMKLVDTDQNYRKAAVQTYSALQQGQDIRQIWDVAGPVVNRTFSEELKTKLGEPIGPTPLGLTRESQEIVALHPDPTNPMNTLIELAIKVKDSKGNIIDYKRDDGMPAFVTKNRTSDATDDILSIPSKRIEDRLGLVAKTSMVREQDPNLITGMRQQLTDRRDRLAALASGRWSALSGKAGSKGWYKVNDNILANRDTNQMVQIPDFKARAEWEKAKMSYAADMVKADPDDMTLEEAAKAFEKAFPPPPKASLDKIQAEAMKSAAENEEAEKKNGALTEEELEEARELREQLGLAGGG